MMDEAIRQAAQYGLPAILLLVVMWRQRENERDCREDRNRIWAELVRLATRTEPTRGRDHEPED